MSSRHMSLLPRATLHSDSEQKGLPLRMCRQGHFYIFNQALSLNLQKIIQQHIIGKKWRFS
jgi:hypothetical protein